MRDDYMKSSGTHSDNYAESGPVPDYSELFRVIREAGPSNPAKARAVDRILNRVRHVQGPDIKGITLEFQAQTVICETQSDSVKRITDHPLLFATIGNVIQGFPQWLRVDLTSSEIQTRTGAEETLIAMIVATLILEDD